MAGIAAVSVSAELLSSGNSVPDERLLLYIFTEGNSSDLARDDVSY